MRRKVSVNLNISHSLLPTSHALKMKIWYLHPQGLQDCHCVKSKNELKKITWPYKYSETDLSTYNLDGILLI